MWSSQKCGNFLAMLVLLALIALVYLAMRMRLFTFARQTKTHEPFAQDKLLVPQAVWPNLHWDTTILNHPDAMRRQVIFSMDDNTVNRASTGYHGNHYGMRFKTPVDITFERARIDADREGPIAFRISEWNDAGDSYGETIAEQNFQVQQGEQWIDLNLSVEGNKDKSYVIWYPREEIKSDVSLKRTDEENMYTRAKVGPVEFMGGYSPKYSPNTRWYYLFQLEIAVPLYSLFDKDMPKPTQPVVAPGPPSNMANMDASFGQFIAFMLMQQLMQQPPQSQLPPQIPTMPPNHLRQQDSYWIRKTDWRGGDLTSIMARNPQHCVQECKANSQCGALAYKTDTGHCWLKDKNQLPYISRNNARQHDFRDIWVKDRAFLN